MVFNERLEAAIRSIDAGNNGYADIGCSPTLAEAVVARGYVVIATRDLHGIPVYRGFTKRSQRALAQEPFGVSTYKAAAPCHPGPDYEDLILRAQERRALYD